MENPSFQNGFPFGVKHEPVEIEARNRIRCEGCGGVEFDAGDDGFFYCRDCGGQCNDMLETECLEEDMYADEAAVYNARYVRHTQSQSQSMSQAQIRNKTSKEEILRSLARNLGNVKEEKAHGFDDEFSQPLDFGNDPNLDEKTLAESIRLRYVQGMQLLMQMQCADLVKSFGVNSVVCGIVGDIWLRYLAARKVFDVSWVDKAILEAEAAAHERHGSGDKMIMGDAEADSRAIPKRKPIYIWASSLRKIIPIHSSLAFIFLGCHMAREQILPTDLVKWATEGKIPYLTAFSVIEQSLDKPRGGFPLSSRFLFRPVYTLGSWQLESTAASIAQTVGLHLPPVNFYAIARRYLIELSLPVEEVLQTACCIYEWSMPSELWISANPFSLPTRVCVMSILVVSVRILYGIHGLGAWERSGSNLSKSKIDPVAEDATKAQFDAVELLSKLEAKYHDMQSVPDHFRNFRSYLNYCKDMVFAGVNSSYEEEKLIESLWDMYDKQEEDAPKNEEFGQPSDFNRKRSRDEVRPVNGDAIARMKQSMKDHGFEYLLPRLRRRTDDYLHYRRKKVDGRLIFVAHADYFILLRAAARLAEIDARIAHLGVLRLERRLRWLERRISRTILSFRPSR